ncbi:esterase family protein [Mycobacterium sp. DBP42]|nr:esterase family protein [Mycobacterium sp. DBP42]
MTFTHHLSLMHGWVPTSIQVITAGVLSAAVGWRTRRWALIWLPLAAAVGGVLVAGTRWYIESEGLAGNPAPRSLWVWIALTGVAVVVLLAGWRGSRWWRRGTAVMAVPMSLLCTALALNLWVGYFPWVQTAWNQLTAGPLPDQTDQVTVAAMQRQGTIPAKGSVIPVEIPNTASGFRHRGEYVYLPPAWFAANPAPQLPTVMMIGGEFNTPADWMRAGNVIKTMDEFAAAHHGYAPVLVFADPGGTFNNDTECVNGKRGNSADHLTKDVVPYLNNHYGVNPGAAGWGIVGWSMGGTCAVDLAVMHPELFSAFVDIAGDIGPNSGTKAQTIDRLFGGNVAAWDTFDPSTAINRHGQYQQMAGWFDVNDASTAGRPAGRANDQAKAASALCALGSKHGIACAVVTQQGTHDWPFASHAFSAALPWLAGAIGTPQVPAIGLPQSSTSPAFIQTAAK